MMFKAIVKSTLMVFLWNLLRPRWKRLSISLAIVLLANYFHGEYISFLQVIPAVQAAQAPVWASYLLKYLAFFVALLIGTVPEFRNRLAEDNGQIESGETSGNTANQDDPFAEILCKPDLKTEAEQILQEPSKPSLSVARSGNDESINSVDGEEATLYVEDKRQGKPWEGNSMSEVEDALAAYRDGQPMQTVGEQILGERNERN